MNYLSVCSGIEAATMAWHPLGWKPYAFAEIAPFPSAVLAHHYPDVPNLGDMTRYEEWPSAVIDVLVGGTPCQSFSVAGLRGGLDDARGNLMLTYACIARKYRPAWVVWENVPGVLSSNGGRDFASLLGLLSGRNVICPAGGWKNSGVVPGIESAYGLTWRVLDAQYFGVAQRRRRVFVIGHLGDWRRAAAVLLERESLRGDPAPRRKSRERPAPCISARSKGGGGLGTDTELDGGLIPENTGAITARFGGNATGAAAIDAHEDKLIVMSSGQANAELGNDQSPALTCLHEAPIICGTSLGAGEGVSPTLGDGIKAPADTQTCIAIPINADALRGEGRAKTPSPDAEGRVRLRDPGFGVGEPGDPAGTIAAAGPRAVAFSAKDHGADAAEDIAPTLRSMGHDSSHANGGGQIAVAFKPSHYTRGKDSGPDVVAPPLTADEDKGDQDAVVLAPAQAVSIRGREGGATAEVSDVPSALRASQGGGDKAMALTAMRVRRLTPVECERLQGFPDNFTLIPTKKVKRERMENSGEDGGGFVEINGEVWQLAADSPRYKALGNSMAVPVMRWIGKRIDLVTRIRADGGEWPDLSL